EQHRRQSVGDQRDVPDVVWDPPAVERVAEHAGEDRERIERDHEHARDQHHAPRLRRRPARVYFYPKLGGEERDDETEQQPDDEKRISAERERRPDGSGNAARPLGGRKPQQQQRPEQQQKKHRLPPKKQRDGDEVSFHSPARAVDDAAQRREHDRELHAPPGPQRDQIRRAEKLDRENTDVGKKNHERGGYLDRSAVAHPKNLRQRDRAVMIAEALERRRDVGERDEAGHGGNESDQAEAGAARKRRRGDAENRARADLGRDDGK